MILIRVVDNKWMDHIDAMDQLKSGIGLRGLGGQDPAAAYAQEGFDMFELLVNSIKEDFVKFCYNVTVQTTTERKDVIGTGESRKDEFDEEAVMSGGQDVPAGAVVPESRTQTADRQKRRPESRQKRPMPMRQRQKIQTLLREDDSPRVAR